MMNKVVNRIISSHYDLKLNEFGLVIVDRSEKEVGHKIALNYLDSKLRIKHALACGKTVLFLPGTYDLLHAGHIVWFHQAMAKFCSKLNLTREEVFTVVPFDNDKLVRIRKIDKHTSQGGNEIYIRPIINERNRSVALANLSYIDLVMPIPSPLDEGDMVPIKMEFDMENAFKELNKFELRKNVTKKESAELRKVLKRFEKVITPSHFNAIKKAFISKGFLASEPKQIYKRIGIDDTLWNNAAWQLLCFLYKMDREFFETYNSKTQKVYRMVSEHDGYVPQVTFFMGLAGIKTMKIREDYVTSTTQIIKDNNSRDKMDDLIKSSDPRNYRFT